MDRNIDHRFKNLQTEATKHNLFSSTNNKPSLPHKYRQRHLMYSVRKVYSSDAKHSSKSMHTAAERQRWRHGFFV